jgi:hypothetical protein
MIRLVEIAVGRPRLVLLVTAALSLVLAAGGLRLELRTDGAALEPQGDPVVERSARDRIRFRDPRTVLLVVSANERTPLASPRGFRFLRDLHSELRRLPVLRPGEILSLAGLPRIVRGGGGISLGTHLDAIPDAAEDFAALLAAVEKAGRALFSNAAALATGFLVLTASGLKPNHSLGLLLATPACYAGSFLLLPLLLQRGSGRFAASAASLALLCVAFPSVVQASEAQEPACDGSSDPAATRLMERVEQRTRSVPHILRMHIAQHYHPEGKLAQAFPADPEPKTVWGVVGGDPRESWQLFVFSGPGRMAGTSLLLRDLADAQKPDAMWFYLRAFENFEQLGSGAERVVVPGTALTYEDARGFVASDKYGFRSLADRSAAVVRILGCPRTPEIADALGYGAILLDVDPELLFVRRVDYRGLGGRPLKQYAVLEEVALGDRVFPTRVRLDHRVNGFSNDIRYEFWRLETGPEMDLFRPDLAGGTFLARLQRFLRAHGLGERIDAEIAAADERVRVWEERWGGRVERRN